MKLADLATGSDWIVWIVFVIFAALSITLLSGHGSWFISGYNTATKEEKELPLNLFEVVDIEDRFPVKRVKELLNEKK